MAFGNGTQFEVNGSIGSDTANGGGFDTGNTNFATDLAVNAANTASPSCTSGSYTFITRDVGAFLFIQGGSNLIPGLYPIASVSGGAATLNAAIGAAVLYNGQSATNLIAGCSNMPTTASGTWGIDYSRSATPAISFTDMVIGATTTQFTSVANPVGPNVVGNLIAVTGGTGFTVQWVEVLSFTLSGLIATCDKSLGTTLSTSGNGGLGGCLATPGMAAGLAPSGFTMFIMGGVVSSQTYNLTGTANVSGGKLSVPTGSVIGYSAPANRYAYNMIATSNQPILQSNANSISLISVGNPNTGCHCINFQNGNSNTAIVGYDDSNGWGNDTLWNCTFSGLAFGAKTSTTSIIDWCNFSGCTTNPLSSNSTDRVQVKNSTFTGTRGGGAALSIGAAYYYRNVFYNNTWSTSGICGGGRGVEGCLFHSNSGASGLGAQGILGPIENCIFWNNTGSSSTCISDTSDSTAFVNNCAFGSNTADIATGSTFPGFRILNKITLSGDPCVNASGGNFALNNTAGAGAACQGMGFPAEFANALTANYLDLGPAQHQGATAAANFGY